MFDCVCVVVNAASNFVSVCLGLVSVHSQLCVLLCCVCEMVYVVCVFIWCLFVLSVVVSQRRCLFDVLCVQEQTQSRRCQGLGVQYGVCESMRLDVVL